MQATQKHIALVTGANKGIGFETANQLGKLGMTVLIGARDRTRGEQAVAALRATGCDAHLCSLDITSTATIAKAVSQLEASHGRLDVLVNNAGIMSGGGSPIAEPLQALREAFESNLIGAVAVTQAMMPLLRRAPAARIVNVSSAIASLTLSSDPTTPIASQVFLAYSCSKAALNTLTVRLANELRDTAIKVNSACPGYVATDLNGHRGPRTVQQGATIIVRLATLPSEGPTGGFFNEAGSVPW